MSGRTLSSKKKKKRKKIEKLHRVKNEAVSSRRFVIPENSFQEVGPYELLRTWFLPRLNWSNKFFSRGHGYCPGLAVPPQLLGR